MALDLVAGLQLVEGGTGEVLGGGSKGEVTVNLLQAAPVQVAEVTGKRSSTLDGLQVADVEGTQQRVVEHVELAVDLGEVGHVQGGQVVVGEDLQRRTSEGERVEGHRVEGVVAQDERAVDVLQVGDVERSDVLDGQVGGGLQVGQLHGGLVVVEGQRQAARDGLQVGQVDRGDVLVVVDVQHTNGLELQKLVDGSQRSVGEGKRGDVGETRAQVKVGERGQRHERQLVGRRELHELDVVQGGQRSQGQRPGDVGDGVQVDAGDGAGVEHSDISLDGLHLAQVQCTHLVARDGDLTVQGRARVQLGHSTGSSDGGGHGARVGRGGVGSISSSEGSQY